MMTFDEIKELTGIKFSTKKGVKRAWHIRKSVHLAGMLLPGLKSPERPPWYLPQVFAYAPIRELREFCRLVNRWRRAKGFAKVVQQYRRRALGLFLKIQALAPKRWRGELYMVAFDPSIRVTGYAIYLSGSVKKKGGKVGVRKFRLYRTGLLIPTYWTWYNQARRDGDRWRIAYDCIDQIELVYRLSSLNRITRGRLGIVFGEQPMVMSGSRRGAAAMASGDILCLTACAATLRQSAKSNGVFAEMVTPAKWKGNTPKAITRKRMVRKWGIPQDMDHNEVDAVAIGDWALQTYFQGTPDETLDADGRPRAYWRPIHYTEEMMEAPPHPDVALDNLRLFPKENADMEPKRAYVPRVCRRKLELFHKPGYPVPRRGKPNEPGQAPAGLRRRPPIE